MFSMRVKAGRVLVFSDTASWEARTFHFMWLVGQKVSWQETVGSVLKEKMLGILSD